MTSCVLSDATSCGGSLTGSNIAIGSSPNWAITAKQSVPAGYISKVCIRCIIGTHVFDWDGRSSYPSSIGWKITQGDHCYTQLVAKTGPADVEILYLAGGADSSIAADYEDFFDALDKTNCPVTDC